MTHNQTIGNRIPPHHPPLPQGRLTAYLSVVIVILLCGPAIAQRLHEQKQTINLEEWPLTSGVLDKTAYGFIFTADDTANGSSPVQIRIQHFAQQGEDHEAVSDINLPYDSDEWKLRSSSILNLPKSKINVERLLLSNEYGRERLVLRCYYSNARIAARGFFAKTNNLIGLIRGQPQISVITFTGDAESSVTATQARLQNAADMRIPELIAALDRL